jgi:hypothetical protein
MGLDADALSRVTSGAFLGNLEQSNQRLEALARIIAESGLKPLFLKLHRLMLTHQKESFEAKIGGKWEKVDPAEWRERDDMTVTVGLGTGNKQAQMIALEKVQEVQAALIQGGKEGILIDDQKIYNSSAKLIEITGLHNPEKYFLDPSKQPPPQPKQPEVDPLVAVQEKLVEVEKMKVQLKAQTDMAAQQSKNAELQMKLAEKQQELNLKERALDIKEHEVMINSELKQAEIDQKNSADINKAQAALRSETDG